MGRGDGGGGGGGGSARASSPRGNREWRRPGFPREWPRRVRASAADRASSDWQASSALASKCSSRSSSISSAIRSRSSDSASSSARLDFSSSRRDALSSSRRGWIEQVANLLSHRLEQARGLDAAKQFLRKHLFCHPCTAAIASIRTFIASCDRSSSSHVLNTLLAKSARCLGCCCWARRGYQTGGRTRRSHHGSACACRPFFVLVASLGRSLESRIAQRSRKCIHILEAQHVPSWDQAFRARRRSCFPERVVERSCRNSTRTERRAPDAHAACSCGDRPGGLAHRCDRTSQRPLALSELLIRSGAWRAAQPRPGAKGKGLIASAKAAGGAAGSGTMAALALKSTGSHQTTASAHQFIALELRKEDKKLARLAKLHKPEIYVRIRPLATEGGHAEDGTVLTSSP